MRLIFTESASRPIQSISCDVRDLSAPCPQLEICIGIPLDIFGFLMFHWVFFLYEICIRVFGSLRTTGVPTGIDNCSWASTWMPFFLHIPLKRHRYQKRKSLGMPLGVQGKMVICTLMILPGRSFKHAQNIIDGA